MLASALVIFREVLEAALIVGIIMAATQEVARRNVWVMVGIAGGLAGSIIVAAFTDVIAAAAAGLGQELLNAAILFTAVAVLGWSIVWMRRHGRELSAHARTVGQSVSEGAVAIHMLAVVIGLSVLREGAEAVLFLYGIAASGGNSAGALLLGGAIGLAGGVAVGWLMYLGLIRIAARHLFGVTSWMLALLAAGLASQGAAALIAAGVLPPLVNSVWDSSSLLSERNILGQVLHTLIGYDSRPALIQVLFYAVTLGVIAVMMRFADRRPMPGKGAVAAALFAVLLIPHDALADAKVYSPRVEYRELAVEIRGDARINRGTTDKVQDQIYEIEYGVTPWWQTAIFSELEQETGGSLNYAATAWENIFRLTEPGEAWMDSGVYIEYERGHVESPDKLEGKLLLEKQFGPTVETVNFIAEKEVGGYAESGAAFEYAARAKYRFRRYVEPAVEAYGDIGHIDRPPSRQEHRLGPVVLGKIPVVSGMDLYYELGWLFGLTDASPDHSFKWLLEFEFPL
jgi:high-affinity iron transporter